MAGAEALLMRDDSAILLDSVRAELLDEYRQSHSAPWIVGYSGGKDSTLVAHLVFEMLMELPPSLRVRPVHIVGNDTLVESRSWCDTWRKVSKRSGKRRLPSDFPWLPR